MSTPYQTRITRMTVLPEGDPIFSEHATHVEVEDEAVGEFVVIRQVHSKDGAVAITPEDWPMIKKAVDQLIGSLREEAES